MNNSMNHNKTDYPLLLSFSHNEQTIHDSPEERSWTFYMQDFLSCGNNHQNHDDPDDHDDDNQEEMSTPHLHHHHHQDVSDAFSSSSSSKKACDAIKCSRPALSSANQFSPEKRKPNLGASSSINGHDSEDTANSPANSPKVSYLNELYFNPDEKNKIKGRNGSTKEMMRTEGEDQNNNNESELKKKGLCLVPVSVLRNYFV